MIQDRYYQTEAIDSVFNYYANGNTGNPVLALPTGTGKGVIIAKFSKMVLTSWAQQRFLVITHVKELIEQNYGKVKEVWPEAPAGIFSAGMRKRDIIQPIIFGGVQSMVNCASDFGWRDLVLIDECHLVSGKDDSNYGKLISKLKAINPALKVIGLSATPWRMGNGLLSDGPVFTDICYDITGLEAFNRLIAEGYLCPLIPKRTNIQLNTDDIAIQGGDFVQNQLQAAVDKDQITQAAVKETIQAAWNRKSILAFASGIEHAEHVAGMFNAFGIDAVAVHSKMKADRDKVVRDFKMGKLRCVVNNNVLTTGFDFPELDCIVMLRPTMSTALWVQMLGRGTRPAELKENCLVLDFAKNTERLGPINDPVIPKKRGHKAGTMPVRICDDCGTYNHARATECVGCGKKFEILTKITKQASNHELIATSERIVEEFNVTKVIYARYQKNEETPPMIKASYICDLRMFTEYVCIEHVGFAGKKAKEWWLKRMGCMPPLTTDEALKYVGNLTVPRKLRVLTSVKYPEILDVAF
jgi:DNA repair protein RadD